jgi:hypothetical protein
MDLIDYIRDTRLMELDARAHLTIPYKIFRTPRVVDIANLLKSR